MLLMATLFLLIIWGASTWRVLSTGRIVSPLNGWMIGLSFFIVLPLSIIVLNGGYVVPSYYQVDGAWGRLDLSDSRFH